MGVVIRCVENENILRASFQNLLVFRKSSSPSPTDTTTALKWKLFSLLDAKQKWYIWVSCVLLNLEIVDPSVARPGLFCSGILCLLLVTSFLSLALALVSELFLLGLGLGIHLFPL